MTHIVSEPFARVSVTGLPAVECAPWCEEGSGHPDALHAVDQYCTSPVHRVSLIREQLIEGQTAGSYMLDHMQAHLIRERFESVPHVSLCRNDLHGVALTLDEARELGQVLLALADLGEQEGRDRERNAFQIGRDAERLGLMKRD